MEGKNIDYNVKQEKYISDIDYYLDVDATYFDVKSIDNKKENK